MRRATQFAVVYGAQSRVIRRIVDLKGDPDDRHIARAEANLGAGEAIMVLKLADYPERTMAAVQPAIGEPAHSGRCAVVSAGRVVATVRADPLIDRHPLGTLVQSDTAEVGHTWSAAAGFGAPEATP